MSDPLSLLAALLYAMVFWNLLLFVFNLIPLFPIDGWHIVLSALPGSWLTHMQVPVVVQRSMRPLAEFLMRPAFKWRDWQMASYYVFIALIFLSFLRLPGFNPFGLFIAGPVGALLRLLLF